MLRNQLAAFFVAALAAAAAFSASKPVNSPLESQGLKFSPMLDWVRLAPGESKDMEFTLVNDSQQTAIFSALVRDTQLEKDGSRSFTAPGTDKFGAGKWVALKPMKIVSRPGTQNAFTAKVSVPAGTPSGNYYAALSWTLEALGGKEFVVSSHEEEMTAGVGAGFKVHMAIAVTLHIDVRSPSDPVPAPQVEAVSDEVIAQTASRPLSISVKLHNQSHWEVRPTGSVLLLDASGKPAGKADFEDKMQLWGDDTRSTRANFSQMFPPGKYQAVVVLTMKDPFDPTAVGIYKPATVRRKINVEVTAGGAAPAAGPQGK